VTTAVFLSVFFRSLMSKEPSDEFRPFRSRSPRGRGGAEQVFVRRSASPLRHGHCNKERGNGRDRDRDADRTTDGRDRQRHERGGVRDRDTKQRGRALSPLRRQSARDEGRDTERDREREKERERERQKRERERERERNRESGGVRGGDAGGYRRDDKGRKDGGRDAHGRDAHGRHRDCYGDSRGTEKFPDLKRNIEINKQIMRAQGASELCTLIEARVAEFNQVVALV
jgi:hypothetical protein